MPNLQISINTRRPMGLLRARAQGSNPEWLLKAVQAAISGTNQSDGIMWSANDAEALGTSAHLGQACAGLFLLQGTATGTVGGVIAGVTSTAIPSMVSHGFTPRVPCWASISFWCAVTISGCAGSAANRAASRAPCAEAALVA